MKPPLNNPPAKPPFTTPPVKPPITTPPVKPPITTPPANPLLPTREAPYYHPTCEVPYYHPTHEAPFYHPTREVPFYHSTQEAPFLPTHLWSGGSAGGRSSCSIVPSTQRGVVQTEHRLPTLTITKAARLKQHLMGVLQDVWGWSRRHVHMQGSTQGETQGWWGLLEHFWYAPFHFDIPVLIIPGWNCSLEPCWFAYYNKCEVCILRPEQLFLKCGKQQQHEPKSKSSGFACRNSHTHTHTQPSTVLNKMFHRVLLKNPLLILHKCSRTLLQMTSFTTTLLLSIPCAKGYAPYRTWTEGRLSCCSGHHRWEQCSGWTWVGGGWLPQPQRCDDCYTSDEAAPPGSRFWGVNRFSE